MQHVLKWYLKITLLNLLHKRWDGGGGGNRTRVLLSFKLGIYKFSWNFYVFFRYVGNQPPQPETPP